MAQPQVEQRSPPVRPPAAPCVADDASLRVVVDDGVALVCTDAPAQCMAIDLQTGVSKAAAYVAPPKEAVVLPHGTVERPGLEACFGGHCRKLGPRLRAALAAFEAAIEANPQDDHWTPPSATTDLAAVTFMPQGTYGPQVWSVARDRQIPIEESREDNYGVWEVVPVGRALFVNASPPIERVFTSAGKLVTALGNERSQTLMLDDNRWAVVTAHQQLYIFEGDRNHHYRTIPLIADMPSDEVPVAMAVRPDQSVVVAIQRPERPVLVLVDSLRGEIICEWPLRRCLKET